MAFMSSYVAIRKEKIETTSVTWIDDVEIAIDNGSLIYNVTVEHDYDYAKSEGRLLLQRAGKDKAVIMLPPTKYFNTIQLKEGDLLKLQLRARSAYKVVSKESQLRVDEVKDRWQQ